MNKTSNSEQPINLHSIPALQLIIIRDGVTLRPLKKSDASSLLDILDADPNIRNRVSVASKMHTPDDVAAEVETYRKDIGLIRYVIVEHDNVVGLVSLWRDDGFWGNAANIDDYGFGYFLHPKVRGRGLVSSAVEALMTTVQNHLLVRQFVAFCEPDNIASVAVLAKLGFKSTRETFVEPDNGWEEEKYVKLLER